MNYLSLREKRNLLKKELTIAELNYTNLKHELTEKLNALKMSNQHEIDFFTVNNDALNVCIIIKIKIKNMFVFEISLFKRNYVFILYNSNKNIIFQLNIKYQVNVFFFFYRNKLKCYLT